MVRRICLLVAVFSMLIAVQGLLAQPWEPEIIWQRNGLDPNSHYGRWILPLGDQNDDGFSDWAVCAPSDPSGSEGGGGRPGRVDFFHGGLTPPANPFFVWYTDLDSGDDFFAHECGDVNGDGYIDILRTDYYLDIAGERDRLYLGGVGFDAPAIADWWFSYWGDWMEGLGDWNGDGYDDLFHYYANQDYVEIYYGAAAIDTLADWSFHSPPSDPQMCLPLSHGDLNGDGFEDYISEAVSLPFRTYVFFGSAVPDTILDWTISDFKYGAIVNDLNGDGASELVGAWGTGIEVRLGGATIHEEPDFTLIFPYQGTDFTYGGLGDINGDGYGDLGVVAESNPNGGDGFAAVYLGHPWINPQPQVTIAGGETPYNLRGFRCIVGLGDVNGDSIADFGIGAFTGFGDPRGRAVVIAGDTFTVPADDPHPPLPSDLAVGVYPNPFNSIATVHIIVPPIDGKIQLTLFNVLGQIVMHDELLTTGAVQYHLRGDNLAAGLYLLSVRAGSYQATTKVMLLK